MGFNNPLTGENGSLIYQQIKSPNFSAGISGWIVRKDGSAEFNNLTIRGTFFGNDFIISSSGVFFYSGVPAFGNLILSLAGAAGNDSFGNAYPEGLKFTAAGESLVLGILGGSPLIYGITGLPETNGSAIQIIKQGVGTGAYEFMQFLSGEDSTQLDLMLAALGGSSADGTQKPQFSVQYKDSLGVFHLLVSVLSAAMTVNVPMTVNGQVAVNRSANSSAVSASYSVANATNAAYAYTSFDATGRFVSAMVAADAFARFIGDVNGAMAWGSGAAARDAFLQRAAAGVLALSPTVVVGATAGLGDNGVGEVQIANATTVPTTNPVGGGVLYAKQGVPTWRDSGGQTLGMVRSYSADSNANLASFMAETDVPGATVSVVVTGSNATVIVHGQFDMMIGTTAGTTMVGFLSWNGADRSEQAVMISPTVGDRKCLGRTWRITGVTAGTYVAKLRASCTASAANNLVEATHTGLVVEVIDQ